MLLGVNSSDALRLGSLIDYTYIFQVTLNMSLLSTFRVTCTNLGCFGTPTNVHNAPSATWLLEHQHQRHRKPASTKGRTPSASLYQIYKYLVIRYTISLHSKIKYFFNQLT
jgi:hypothetical protein